MRNRLIRTSPGVAALIACCALATAADGRVALHQGGTLRVNLSNTLISTLDPAVDYEFYGGQLLYATCVRLLNYSDVPGHVGELVPEAAAGRPVVTDGGRTYTFTVRSGYRFNTGEPVTAQSFVRAAERVLAKRAASPGAQFYNDILGASDVLAGRDARPRGVTVHGDTITFRLLAPSPTFPARLAMSFFCAQPPTLPVSPHGVALPPMAGPYYVASFDPRRTIVLKRNPYYHGPRAAHVDRIVVTMGTSLETSLLQVRAGQADFDLGGLPPAGIDSLARNYGVNKGRFFVHPGLLLQYLALNTRHGPLRDVRVRRAINLAVDRTEISRLSGRYGGRPTDQVLVAGIPGYHDVQIYPDHPDLARAKALIGRRRLTLTMYSLTGQPFDDQAVVIAKDLAAIGMHVEVKPVEFDQLIRLVGNPGNPYDIVSIGWGPDFIDPFDYLDVLLNGNRISAQNNVQWSLFDDPTFDKRLDAAAHLVGARRYAAYGRIDADVMRTAAPLAPLYTANVREFVSSRFGCYTFVPALQSLSLAASCID